MRPSIVISITQAFSILLGISFIWGIFQISELTACGFGGSSFCAVSPLLMVVMGSMSLVAFAFALFLFRAYSDD